jgi:hypothetical protein
LKKSSVLRIQNNREKTNRLSGGQKNHQGETLQQSSHPDKMIQHTPEICSACRANLVDFPLLSEFEKRQVFDMRDQSYVSRR